MARVQVDVDIEDYLDEVQTIDLEKELESRRNRSIKKMTRHEKDDFNFNVYCELKIDNLSDVMKFEHFMKKFRNIPESVIDSFLNNY